MADVDTQNTPVHLLDTVISDTAHAIRHIERLGDDGVSDDERTFNAEHALKHAVSAQEHAHKVRDHLTENDSEAAGFAAERAQLDSAHDAAQAEVKQGKRKGMSNFIKTLPRK